MYRGLPLCVKRWGSRQKEPVFMFASVCIKKPYKLHNKTKKIVPCLGSDGEYWVGRGQGPRDTGQPSLPAVWFLS